MDGLKAEFPPLVKVRRTNLKESLMTGVITLLKLWPLVPGMKHCRYTKEGDVERKVTEELLGVSEI